MGQKAQIWGTVLDGSRRVGRVRFGGLIIPLLVFAIYPLGASAQQQKEQAANAIAPNATKVAASAPEKQSSNAQDKSGRFTQPQSTQLKWRHPIRPRAPRSYDLAEDVLPESQCSADQAIYLSSYSDSSSSSNSWSSDSWLDDSPARVQQHNSELVEPMEGVQEDLDERVPSMPRVGED